MKMFKLQVCKEVQKNCETWHSVGWNIDGYFKFLSYANKIDISENCKSKILVTYHDYCLLSYYVRSTPEFNKSTKIIIRN